MLRFEGDVTYNVRVFICSSVCLIIVVGSLFQDIG